MLNRKVLFSLLLSSTVAFGQSAPAAPTTLPIVFTTAASADHSKAGDRVEARTTQVVQLADGTVIARGSRVTGHVVAANGFSYDKTPYAHQKTSALSIQFDAVEVAGKTVPLHVAVRAVADPLTSAAARTPKASDMDSLGTVTQIGGDQLIPSQSEVTNQEGDVVAYNKRGGVYAHLIANGRCDGSDVEVSVGIYSASACGVYGFAKVSAEETGSPSAPSTLTLVSSHVSPKIWKDSTALLEVLPAQSAVASR